MVNPITKKQKEFNDAAKPPTENQNAYKYFQQQKSTAEYNMFASVYVSVGKLRDELSQMLYFARISANPKEQAAYLEASIMGMKSLLQYLVMVLNDNNYRNMKEKYFELETITLKFTRRHHIIKIPQNVVREVDDYFELILRILQLSGLGIKLSDSQANAIDSLERTIVGD